MITKQNSDIVGLAKDIQKDIESNVNLSSMRELYNALLDLNALKSLSVKLDDSLKKRMVQNLLQDPATEESNSAMDLIRTCFELKLMKTLGMENNDRTCQKFNILKKKLSNGLPSELDHDKMTYLYYLVSTFSEYHVDDINKEKIKQEVLSCVDDRGLYKMGTGDSSFSFRSSYYALSILGYLNQN